MANIKISQLPSLATLADSSVLAAVDSSTNYKVSGSVLKTYVQQGGGIFLASEGGTGTTGYSFVGDGGYDTGMFSSADGYIQFYSNNTKVIEVNPTGTITTVLKPLVVKDVRDTIYTGGGTTGTITPDCANGDVQTITLTGSITLNAFANPVSGQTMTLIITQPSSGGPCTLTSSMKFAGSNKTLSTAANAVDMLTISYIGSTYYASLVVGFA